MSRGRTIPPDDNITWWEWMYLKGRYSDSEEAQERRARIVVVLRRFVRKGGDAKQFHTALMNGIDRWREMSTQVADRRAARRWNAKVARARRDLDRALESLRQLVPTGPHLVDYDDDDELLGMRDFLLNLGIAPTTNPKRGRPAVSWKQETDAALQAAGLNLTDRQEILAAIGFTDDA